MRVVGLGASAGGMEALIALLSQLPDNTGAAFVLILHLSPDHPSMMDELLSRHASMPIKVVNEMTPVEPNRIYIISKDSNLTLENGLLVTHPRDTKGGLNLPIDQFFHSLGKSLQEKAIGVILSGTGTDGSRGVRTIKEAGGLVLVQSPESAKFDGMPQSVIRLQLADRVMNPAELAKIIADILKWSNRGKDTLPSVEEVRENAEPYLNRVLKEVFNTTGVDFSGYRETTLNRRLANRVLLHRLSEPEDYLEILRNEREEIIALQKDFLIGVTRFFRDPPAYEVLEQTILPRIMEDRKRDEVIRIWVPACSTGEEAYSIALLIARYLEQHQLDVDYKIFGTDVDSGAIKLASEGAFSYNCAADIPDDLLLKYFVKEADFYRIRTEIRDKMLFAVHNLLHDPPFIHMDLISCRNALIYFKPEAQRSVLSTFHFALNSGGYLFLGPSESLGEVKHAYTKIDRKWNFFQKKENTQLVYQSGQLAGSGSSKDPVGKPLPKRTADVSGGDVALGETDMDPFTRYLLEHHIPPVLFVDEELDVIYIQGEVDHLLSFPRGGAGFNLQHMVGREQMMILKNGVQKVVEGDRAVMYRDVGFAKGHKTSTVDLRFSRVRLNEEDAVNIMIELLARPDGVPPTDSPTEEVGKDKLLKDHIHVLEGKLKQAQENSQELVDKLESTNEELQASNRELLAANEELQSTNEELQSVNEELYTVNNELQLKNENLLTANNDINNLLKSTEIGTIFLDADLKIRRFTPAIRRQFNLLETDIGRPITHFSSTLVKVDIAEISRQVYESLESFEQEVTDNQDNHYLLRILPYRTEEDQIKGLVINFVDVNELMKVKGQIETFANKFQAIFQYSNEIIMVLERDGQVKRINKPFGPYAPGELEGKILYDRLPEAYREPMQQLVGRVYDSREAQEIGLQFSTGKAGKTPDFHFYKGCAIPVTDQESEEKRVDNIIVIWQDISNEISLQKQMEDAIREFESFMDNAVHQIILVDQDGIIEHINFIQFRKLEKTELIGNCIYDFVTEYQGAQIRKAIDQVFAGASSERVEYEMEEEDGTIRQIEVIGTPVIINDRIKYAALIVTVKEN